MVDDPEALAAGRRLVREASAIVVLTGAGISTEAGIPDFRGPQGVWTKDPAAERMSHLRYYLADPDLRRRSWRARLDAPVWNAEPTAGHLALVGLEREGKLDTLVTQNTDGLHQLAGTAPDRVVEVHGTSHWSTCWSCGDRLPTQTVLARVRAGEEDPHCLRSRSTGGRGAADPGEVCGGILKTATVSFGQSLDRDDLERAQLAAARADLLLAVGSTLEVQPVSGIVPLAKASGAAVVIVNGSRTAHDDLADVVIRGRIGEVLPALVAAD